MVEGELGEESGMPAMAMVTENGLLSLRCAEVAEVVGLSLPKLLNQRKRKMFEGDQHQEPKYPTED